MEYKKQNPAYKKIKYLMELQQQNKPAYKKINYLV